MNSQLYDTGLGQLVTQLDSRGATTLLESFATCRHRFNNDVTLIAGLHNMNLMLNGNHTLEPRLGLN